LTNLSNSGTVVQLDFDGDKDPALVISARTPKIWIDVGQDFLSLGYSEGA
jgi:hypothetical protein